MVSTTRPSDLSSIRFSGRGRSSVISQKSTAWRASSSKGMSGNQLRNCGRASHPSPHFLHDGEDVLVCERGGCDRRRSFISAVLARGAPPRTTAAHSGENHATQLPTRRTDLALAPHLSH